MKLPPQDFFLNIAGMAALYVSVVSLITLLFQYVDYLFPDRVSNVDYYYDPYSGAIRYAMASLIIVFPLYIVFTRLVHQDLRKHPEKQEGGFRKWLVYITLFIAGATIAVDLIVLINTFLSGEITIRFALKILVVLIVAIAGFCYYWQELKGTWQVREKESKLIGLVVSLLILSSVISGFFIVGSPMTERDRRFDQERVRALESLQIYIVSYWQAKEELPRTLTDLEDPLVGYVAPVDPENGMPYNYRVTGPLSFELCADFALQSNSDDRSPSLAYPVMKEPSFVVSGRFEHAKGRACFERTIDPERFPPLQNQRVF